MSSHLSSPPIPGLVSRARAFAVRAHDRQLRKGTDLPYFSHCSDVQERLNGMFIAAGFDAAPPQMQAAALLHDTVEDAGVTYFDLDREFGPEVVALVFWLTCVTKSSDGPRELRKRLELERLSCAPRAAQIIKICDMESNLRNVELLDPSFSEVYVAEKRRAQDRLGKVTVLDLQRCHEIYGATAGEASLPPPNAQDRASPNSVQRGAPGVVAFGEVDRLGLSGSQVGSVLTHGSPGIVRSPLSSVGSHSEVPAPSVLPNRRPAPPFNRFLFWVSAVFLAVLAFAGGISRAHASPDGAVWQAQAPTEGDSVESAMRSVRSAVGVHPSIVEKRIRVIRAGSGIGVFRDASAEAEFSARYALSRSPDLFLGALYSPSAGPFDPDVDPLAGVSLPPVPKGLSLIAARKSLEKEMAFAGLAGLVSSRSVMSTPEGLWRVASFIRQANVDLQQVTGWSGPVLGLNGRIVLVLAAPGLDGQTLFIGQDGDGDGLLRVRADVSGLAHEWFHAVLFDMLPTRRELGVAFSLGLPVKGAPLPEMVSGRRSSALLRQSGKSPLMRAYAPSGLSLAWRDLFRRVLFDIHSSGRSVDRYRDSLRTVSQASQKARLPETRPFSDAYRRLLSLEDRLVSGEVGVPVGISPFYWVRRQLADCDPAGEGSGVRVDLRALQDPGVDRPCQDEYWSSRDEAMSAIFEGSLRTVNPGSVLSFRTDEQKMAEQSLLYFVSPSESRVASEQFRAFFRAHVGWWMQSRAPVQD